MREQENGRVKGERVEAKVGAGVGGLPDTGGQQWVTPCLEPWESLFIP